jgi:hypothetical protein
MVFSGGNICIFITYLTYLLAIFFALRKILPAQCLPSMAGKRRKARNEERISDRRWCKWRWENHVRISVINKNME